MFLRQNSVLKVTMIVTVRVITMHSFLMTTLCWALQKVVSMASLGGSLFKPIRNRNRRYLHFTDMKTEV